MPMKKMLRKLISIIQRDGLWYTLKRTWAWLVSNSPIGQHVSFSYYPGTRLTFAPSMLTYRIFADRKTRNGDIIAMEENIRPGDIVIDIGANAGTFAIIAAQLAGPRGHVVAFEPSPKFANIIRKNVELNKFSNTTVHQVALGSHAGEVYLNENVADDTTNYVSKTGTPVPLATLDSYTEDFDKINLIKIDAEGSEEEIIKGAANTFKKTKILLFEICKKTLDRNGADMTNVYQMLNADFELYYKHTKAPFVFDPNENYNTDLLGYSRHI
jgi:FkbM family methyltransferase